MFKAVPAELQQNYYTTAFEWNGLYVLSGPEVQILTIITAAETAFNMLRHRPDLVELLSQNQSRLGISPQGGVAVDLPEFRYLVGEDSFDGRNYEDILGLAGWNSGFIAATNEDNVLALPADPYLAQQNIGLHEWAHVIHMGAIEYDAELNQQLSEAYANAVQKGLWSGTYASSNVYEYFASATEAFFDHSRLPDDVVNHVNTREELRIYDPVVFNFLVEIFGNDGWRDGDWIGSSGSDKLSGLATSDLIFGVGGDDVLVGGDGRDSLYGGAGNDAIWAGGSDSGDDRAFGEGGGDTIGGGEGNDTLVGGLGADLLFGGGGADYMYLGNLGSATSDPGLISNVAWAGSGDDQLYGDNTSDVLGGGSGNDDIAGNAGNDIIYGGKDTPAEFANDDILVGGSGNDTVFGGTGDDSISGQSNDDLLFGGAGDDVINGEAGNDVIWGGSGNDTLTGQAGVDLFGFVTGSGSDRVTDFEVGIDRLDLSGATNQISSYAQLSAAATASGGDVIIDLGGGDFVTLEGITFAELSSIDVVFNGA
jgi:Ca2+-binding RTX toxin-like protein